MKKVLSIDGGGIRGLIPAMLLAEIERRTGRAIADHFDLIAGTSTGGILALGLSKDGGNGRPQFAAEDLVGLYENRGGEIFHRTLWQKITSLGGWRDQTYSHGPLEGILREYFGEAPLGQALKPILITSYDIERREPFFFKSWRPDRSGVQMRFAARATSAAPTYFEPAPVTIGGETRYLVDGGVFVNNPAMCAHASARRMFAGDRDLLVVSLGTGELNQPYRYEEARGWGKARWLVPVMNIVFDGVSDAVAYQLRDILDAKFFRIQSELSPEREAMDDASPGNIGYLMGLARETIRDRAGELDALCKALEGKRGAARKSAARKPAARGTRRTGARRPARRS